MTKKLLRESIEAFRVGDTAQAQQLVASVDRSFIEHRLKHLVAAGDLSKESADAWWGRVIRVSPPLELVNAAPTTECENAAGQPPAAPPALAAAPAPASRRISLDRAAEFLTWLAEQHDSTIVVDDFDMIQPWGLVALAALAQPDSGRNLHIVMRGSTNAARFAHAMGLGDVLDDRPTHGVAEHGRTVKLRRVSHFPQIEAVASEISRLLVPDMAKGSSESTEYIDPIETRRTISYVIVELLRNALQHSRDPRGGVIVAQAMSRGGVYDSAPRIQVAVGDSGIGIYRTLSAMHTEISEPRIALERSIWPYFSGAFDATSRGTSQNAGLGLFFVSEMAKLTGGRLLIASRGESLFLQGDSEGVHSSISFLGADFPGTLVVFELPARGVADYDALIKTIVDRAEERASKREKQRWIRYSPAPPEAFEFLVSLATEDTVVAEQFSRDHLLPRLLNRQPLSVNFANIEVCTQSFMHALLFTALRLAWASQTPIYVKNAAPAVVDGLRLLESYALGDDPTLSQSP